METAEILERRLKVRPQGSHILAGHTYIDGAVQISMLRSAAGVCDVLISVSDFDSPMGIVDALAKELFGNPVAHKVVRYRRVEPGTALCLDLESGKLSQLP
ncbi:hypothetical protein HYV30_01730 [Candidatus Kaiserbacteria bacterium]|nr:hypothetical protein [Candidatus Kaiserbacteria bacterium]